MSITSIHPNTTIGATALIVPDLERSLAYYQHNIGLHLHRRANGQAALGVGGADLLILTEQRGAKSVRRHHTGLYHFAILVPSRVELARTLRHLIATQTPISGASDHAVSEALYLTDPDGHGIEIYRDRPREEWQFPDGQLTMTVDPFDMEGVLAETAGGAPAWEGLHPATVIGHVHLHVAQIPTTEHFYCEVLGFDLMARYGHAASFVSAGGYHHHLGLNTWAGVGAPPPPADAARLDWFALRFPDAAARQAVVDRLHAAGVPLVQDEQGWRVFDPSRNGIRLEIG
jgi:catechol 2,3-dioxygenase